jgi:hypothetical protein
MPLSPTQTSAIFFRVFQGVSLKKYIPFSSPTVPDSFPTIANFLTVKHSRQSLGIRIEAHPVWSSSSRFIKQST